MSFEHRLSNHSTLVMKENIFYWINYNSLWFSIFAQSAELSYYKQYSRKSMFTFSYIRNKIIMFHSLWSKTPQAEKSHVILKPVQIQRDCVWTQTRQRFSSDAEKQLSLLLILHKTILYIELKFFSTSFGSIFIIRQKALQGACLNQYENNCLRHLLIYWS